MMEPTKSTELAKEVAGEAKDITVYFIPPLTTSFMKWGECILVIVFLIIMFSIITILYVCVNMNEYQSRIDVMSIGNLYGVDPQQKFDQYIKNTQAEAIATAMGTIDKSTDTLNRAINRMDDKSTRLTRQLANDTKTTTNSTDSLGKAIQENVGKLGGIMEKMGGVLTLNSYINNGAIKTTQVAPGATPGFSPAGLAQQLINAGPGTFGLLGSNPGGQNPGASPAR